MKAYRAGMTRWGCTLTTPTPPPLRISTCRYGMNSKLVPVITSCELMTIGDAIDWVTWLMCSLQTRNETSMNSSNFQNDFINQLLLLRRYTSESFNVLTDLYPEKLRCCFKTRKHWSVKSDHVRKESFWLLTWKCSSGGGRGDVGSLHFS